MPILAREDLEAMHQRILESEIAPPDGDSGPVGTKGPRAAAGPGERGKRSAAQGARLAAAMGLTQMTLPFRYGTVQWIAVQ